MIEFVVVPNCWLRDFADAVRSKRHDTLPSHEQRIPAKVHRSSLVCPVLYSRAYSLGMLTMGKPPLLSLKGSYGLWRRRPGFAFNEAKSAPESEADTPAVAATDEAIANRQN